MGYEVVLSENGFIRKSDGPEFEPAQYHHFFIIYLIRQ